MNVQQVETLVKNIFGPSCPIGQQELRRAEKLFREMHWAQYCAYKARGFADRAERLKAHYLHGEIQWDLAA